MNAIASKNDTALVRSRNSVLSYFGIDPHSRTERAALYGGVLARVVMAGVIVGGVAVYVMGVGSILI